ncbi:hypothetical protein ACWQ06_16640 [Streptomyces angustmyceticus]|nr:hypothetical protein [Streptomyces sp.]
MGTSDTFKDFIGDIADDTKKAFDELLDRDDDDKDTDLGLANLPLQALAGLPAETLRSLSTLAAVQGLAGRSGKKNSGGTNPLAALALAGNPLAALGAAGNPAAALGLLAGGGLPNPVAGLGQAAAGLNPLAAAGQVSQMAGGAADMAGHLTQLPQQIAQLSELISTLTGVLEGVQGLVPKMPKARA